MTGNYFYCKDCAETFGAKDEIDPCCPNCESTNLEVAQERKQKQKDDVESLATVLDFNGVDEL